MCSADWLLPHVYIWNFVTDAVFCVTIGGAFLGLMDRVSQKQQQHFTGGLEIGICNEKSFIEVF
jgi:hypothetical protein